MQTMNLAIDVRHEDKIKSLFLFLCLFSFLKIFKCIFGNSETFA